MKECYVSKILFAFPRFCRVEGGFVPPHEVYAAIKENGYEVVYKNWDNRNSPSSIFAIFAES